MGRGEGGIVVKHTYNPEKAALQGNTGSWIPWESWLKWRGCTFVRDVLASMWYFVQFLVSIELLCHSHSYFEHGCRYVQCRRMLSLFSRYSWFVISYVVLELFVECLFIFNSLRDYVGTSDVLVHCVSLNNKLSCVTLDVITMWVLWELYVYHQRERECSARDIAGWRLVICVRSADSLRWCARFVRLRVFYVVVGYRACSCRSKTKGASCWNTVWIPYCVLGFLLKASSNKKEHEPRESFQEKEHLARREMIAVINSLRIVRH